MRTLALEKDQLLAAAETALEAVEADQAEVVIQAEDSLLTRFAESVIHQNMAQTNINLTLRAVAGKKVGCAVTNRTDREGLREMAARAGLLAKNSAPNPDFHSLPSPGPITPVEAYCKATAALTPEELAEMVKTMITAADKIGAVASGSLAVASGALVVANSLGIRAYQPWTKVELVTIIADAEGEASGHGEWQGKSIAAFAPGEIARSAAEICARSRGAEPIAPGEYPVVLKAPATAELVNFLAWLGLGAQAVQEGRSFICDQIGKKIAAENITLWDDGHDPRTLPYAFDFEGVPKRKVIFIDKGVAKGVVYDSYTAAKEGKISTGHALPAPDTYGPFPWNLGMEPGAASLEEMVASIERGLLVSRFHYTNVISPRETILTGMTRDGTFLIENGKISRPVQKLRFTESVLKTLQRTEMLGRELQLCEGSLMPAIKVAGFNFTS
jgi:PmbA protein